MRMGRVILVLFFLAVLGAGAVGYWMYNALHTPVSHASTEEYVVIEEGSGANRIIALLGESGIIKEELATRLYVRFINPDIRLEAGDYLFPSPITPLEALEVLKDGKKRTQTLTIPEGWTRFEIAKRVAARFPAEPPVSEEDVLAMMNDVSLIADFDPKAKNLEGYLYPTTYEFELGTHPREVITKMVRQFKTIWQPEWAAKAEQLGRSRREIAIIASLIENESKVDSERPLVASVIYNRLEQGIPLGIDATNVYIAKMLGRWDGIIHKSDVEIDHPYNTRKVYGLPPGPISSASASAFHAALHPAETDYLYYVLNVDTNDGSHHFYSTAAGFAEGKAAYQRWLAKQR